MTVRLTCVSFLVAASLFGAAVAASEPEVTTGGFPAGVSITTSDPTIPTSELILLLRPLSKNELMVEADAWQGLVQKTAREIAQAEITVQRENIEIAKEDELTEKVREVQQKLENLIATADQAKADNDRSAVPEIKETIAEVQETMREVEAGVDEFAEAHKKKSETAEKMSAETQQALEAGSNSDVKAFEEQDDGDINEAIESVQLETLDKIEKISSEQSDQSEQPSLTGEIEQGQTSVASEVIESFGESIRILEQAEEAIKAEKVGLLDKITGLRDKRTRLLDNMHAAVEELQAKTDSKDSDTLAKIIDYQLYIKRVSGIHVDVTDTTSTWVTIKGWIVSEQGGKRWGLNALRFAGILFVTLFFARLFSGAVRKISARLMFPVLLRDVLITTTRWAVIGIGAIWALSALEFSIAPLLAMVGAAGFVIAFAMQDSLSNFAAGLMILVFRPFDVDDTVDAGGVSGKVSSMNLVSTTIRTFDNKLMIVPNSKIWNEVITNVTGVTQRRVDMVFGIGYNDDVDHAQAVLEEIVASHPLVLKEPEATIKMSELADSSVNFICRPWVVPEHYWDVYWDVTKAVKKRFDAEGIGIPFPQRDVHLHITDS